MPIEVHKKERESNESLLRRFTKKVQSSGTLIRAKRARFIGKKKNETQLKKDALRRQSVRKQIEYLRKVGLLEQAAKEGPQAVKKLIRKR